MISTMPKSGQAPTSPNAMPGGLGAILQQPGGAPKGVSSGSIQQILDRAKSLSDRQLADVLEGKSLDVPQYVAMTEAMGRKSLRTAVQGAQAQQQKKPSLKDTLLAEEAAAEMPQGMPMAPQQPVMAAGGGLMYAGGGAIDMNESADNGGLAMIPAPNMMPMSMAGGGIVAFDEGGEVPRFNGQGSSLIDPLQYVSMPTDPNYIPPKEVSESEKLRRIIAENEEAQEKRNAAIKNFLFTPSQRTTAARKDEPATTTKASKTPAMSLDQLDAIARGQGVFPEGSVALPGANLAAVPAGGSIKEQIDQLNARPKKSGIAAVLDGETEPKKAADDYLAKLAGIGEKTRSGIAGLKNEAQSQILLDAMSALMGSRNIAEAGGKFGTLAAGRVGAMNKEGRALEKEANEYDLNLARYQEAVKSGDQDRALQIKKMLLEHQGRMAALSQEPDTLRTLRGIAGNPQLEALYGKTAKTNQMSLTDAAKQWNDLPKENRKYYKELQSMGINNEQDYYKFVNGQLLSATIPGEGAVKRPY